METVTLAKVKKMKLYGGEQKEYESRKIQLQYGFTRATGGRKPCQDFSLRKTLLTFFQGPLIFRSFAPKVSCPQAFVRFEAALLSEGFWNPASFTPSLFSIVNSGPL
jgi:hypothetical protein